MPALVHVTQSGAHKATIAALRVGDSVVAPSRRAASSLRIAARNMGLRVSVRQLARGKPEQRVTLLPGSQLRK